VSESQRPLLRVVRGAPDEEELAALATVVASLHGPAEEREQPRRSAWADPARKMRTPLQHGTGAWRASAFPR
jgi:hypothetical protein